MTAPAWAVVGALAWLGWSLALSGVTRWRHAPLHRRVAPYLPSPAPRAAPGAGLPTSPAGLARAVAHRGARHLARLTGTDRDLAARLARCHAADDVASFRTRQLGWALAALGLAATAAVALRPPPVVAAAALVVAPVAAAAALEHRVALASARWQRRVLAELPVVGEQLALLLRSGHSLGSAVRRLAERGSGACARDLAGVVARTGQGVGTVDALAEWAHAVDVPAVDRLVGAVRLGGEGADVGRLLTHEVTALRADAHRRLVEAIERRTQQVWVPVTVAALVPGTALLAVPFLAAVDAFSGGLS